MSLSNNQAFFRTRLALPADAHGAALRKNADLLEKQQIEIDLIKKLQEKD